MQLPQERGPRRQQNTPDLDTSSIEILGPLKQAQSLIDLALASLFEAAPVTSAELDMLVVIAGSDQPVIARQLTRRMNLSRAAVSNTLAKLERRTLISRQANPSDRRAALISLTPEAERIIDSLFPAQLAREAELLGGMSSEHRAKVIEGLNTLVDALKRALPGMEPTGGQTAHDCYVSAQGPRAGAEPERTAKG